LVSKLVRPGSSVLDVGCYKGQIIDFLPDVSYHGLDINKEEVKNLRKRGVKAHCVDLNKQDLKINKNFDYILLLDILEHVVDPKIILKKSKNLLKDQGVLIVSLPNDYHFLNKIRFVFNRELFMSFNPVGHLHIFPIKNGKKLLENAGLEIIKEIRLPPTKPLIVPDFIKKTLSSLSPNNFSRGMIYVAKPLSLNPKNNVKE